AAVLILHLCPARDSWPNRMAQAVVRNLVFEGSYKLGALGPRPHETHFASKNVNQLRQLIDAEFSNPLSCPSYSIIPARSPLRALFLCIVVHGAELQHSERLAAISGALLPKQNR